MDTVYITGHKNPDTDSIISAMAYAALKNALGQRQYKAARLGHVSDETQIVLSRFGFEPPEVITDVRTQVRDLDFDTPTMLSPGATISRAWKIMQRAVVEVVPWAFHLSVSRLTCCFSTTSAACARGDSRFSVTVMIFTPLALQISTMGSSSLVLPPREANTITSPSWIKPVAP